MVDQNVLGLHIPVQDILLVKVLQGQDDLCYKEPGFTFVKNDLFLQMELQIASITEVSDQVKVFN
jgi:hypothetical protein